MSLYDIYAKTRHWFQPFWIPRPQKSTSPRKTTPAPRPHVEAPTSATLPVEQPQPEPEPQIEPQPETHVEPQHQVEQDDELDHSIHVGDSLVPRREKSGVTLDALPENSVIKRGKTLDPSQWKNYTTLTVDTISEGLGKAWERDLLPAPNHVWYHHDDKVHELFSHFIPNAGFAHKGRNDAARRKLNPLIVPIGQSFDRTHLIPFGYHASERDERLLIGWDSQQNRGPMKKYEEDLKKYPAPFYWSVRVIRKNNGAWLTYRAWNAKTMKPIKNALTVKMENTKFRWNRHPTSPR